MKELVANVINTTTLSLDQFVQSTVSDHHLLVFMSDHDVINVICLNMQTAQHFLRHPYALKHNHRYDPEFLPDAFDRS